MTAAAENRKTAHDWLRRAERSYRRWHRSGRPAALARATVEADEALEHAAKVGDGGRLVGIVERRIKRAARSRP